jgi:hypothetical protein
MNDWLAKRKNTTAAKAERRTPVRIKLDLDYAICENDDPLFQKNRASLTKFLVEQAFAAKNRDGVHDTARRSITRITNALRRAQNDGASEIEFTMEQVEEIKRALSDWRCNVVLAGWAQDLEDYLEGEIKRAKDEAQAAKNGAAAKSESVAAK